MQEYLTVTSVASIITDVGASYVTSLKIPSRYSPKSQPKQMRAWKGKSRMERYRKKEQVPQTLFPALGSYLSMSIYTTGFCFC